jgi:hypothetical protein
VLGTVAAGQDERGEVRVVVMRAGAQRPVRVWMLTWTKAGQLALIALTGGLDGHRRGVIELALSDG